LVLALGIASADLNCGGNLHEHVHSRYSRQLWPQLVDDVVRAQPLAMRLESENEPSLIATPASRSDGRHEAGDVGVLCHDRGDLLLVPHHLRERCSLRGLSGGDDLTGILRRDEASRNQLVQNDGTNQDCEREHERREAMHHHPPQARLVAAEDSLVDSLGRVEELSVLLLGRWLQVPAREHRRERQ